MIRELIQDVAEYMMQKNSTWLTQVRSVGYLNRSTDKTDYISTAELEEIGLTDKFGNSGYIRFRNKQDFTVRKSVSMVSCESSYRYTFPLRYVFLVDSVNISDLIFLSSIQLQQYSTTAFESIKNVKVVPMGGNSNTIDVIKQETNTAAVNNTYRAGFIDFNLEFDIAELCDTIQLPMNCNCNNVYDLGCVTMCDNIDTEIIAELSGDYTLVTEFNGATVSLKFEGEVSKPLLIPTDGLNADYMFDIAIYDPAGERVTFEREGIEYNCVKVKINPKAWN